MIDLKKIKLIIWDLDDTLWTGTLSEGGYQLPEEHCQLIKDLTDAGIVNSICSKNEYTPTKEELVRLGLWEYFVFASINWDNKGMRIKHLIDNMALRPINVLFVDDNTFNLQDAKHFLPELQIATPDIIPVIIEQLQSIEKKDTTHKRLNQYKILEKKTTIAETYDSNEAFLFSSNIRVTIHTDCLEVIERLHELLMRSNQLNYTKKRIPLAELKKIVSNPGYQCGYVTVTDKYGDYGIVGFYANKCGRLEHFLFSCRTMGQMIEQYVYAQLGFPKLEVVGEVRTQLNNTDCPAWINQSDTKLEEVRELENKGIKNCKILVKGPCDLSNSLSYIHSSSNIVSELTYIDNRGMVIDTYNHIVHIRGLYKYSDTDNKMLLEDCPYIDPAMLNGTFFTGEYDLIFMSSLLESSYNVYRRKGSNLRVVMNSYNNYMESDPAFLAKYECEGYITPELYIQYLREFLMWLPKKTVLCVILGATYGASNEAYRHMKLNNVVKELAALEPRIKYIDVDEFAKDESDFIDGLNHYKTRVYFEIAQAMLRIAREKTGAKISSYSVLKVWTDQVLKKMRDIIKKHISQESVWFNAMHRIYRIMVNK